MVFLLRGTEYGATIEPSKSNSDDQNYTYGIPVQPPTVVFSILFWNDVKLEFSLGFDP
jgi:hypothetical protein